MNSKLNITSISIVFILLNTNMLLFGQEISGIIFEMNDKTPVEFANISITGKNTSTVSDQNGKYRLQINPEYHNDTLIFSSVGYLSYYVKVSDFMELDNQNVILEKKVDDLKEVVVRSKKNREKKFMQRVREWFTSCRKKGDTDEQAVENETK